MNSVFDDETNKERDVEIKSRTKHVYDEDTIGNRNNLKKKKKAN